MPIRPEPRVGSASVFSVMRSCVTPPPIGRAAEEGTGAPWVRDKDGLGLTQGATETLLRLLPLSIASVHPSPGRRAPRLTKHPAGWAFSAAARIFRPLLGALEPILAPIGRHMRLPHLRKSGRGRICGNRRLESTEALVHALIQIKEAAVPPGNESVTQNQRGRFSGAVRKSRQRDYWEPVTDRPAIVSRRTRQGDVAIASPQPLVPVRCDEIVVGQMRV